MDDLTNKPRVSEALQPDDVPCTDTPSERAEKLKAQMAEFQLPESAAEDAIVVALLADEMKARKRLATWEGTETTDPEGLELKEKRVAEAKAVVAALDYRIKAMRGDFSDDEEQTRRAEIAWVEADDANESRILQRRRQEVEALPAATLSELVAKREELNRIDGELHDLDGVMPSEHPNWAAAQLARIQSGNQPFEPIFSLHIGPDERLFAVSEVPAMTARAEYSERYSGNEAEMTTGQRVDRMMIEGLHRDKLMASVRGGHVTPYSGALMHPSPRQWDPSPEAGYVLPIGELRKFAKLLLMEVKTEAVGAPADRESGVGAVTTVVHTLATRRDVLDPAIDLAEKNAMNCADRVSVWNALTALAMAKDKPHPLLGFADKSVQYLDGENAKFLTRDAFNKRWGRRMKKPAASRR